MSAALEPIPPYSVPKQEDRVLAGCCHLAGFFGFPIVGPIVVYFWKKDTSRFVAFHALQATFFHIAAIPLLFVAYLVGIFGAIALAAAAESSRSQGMGILAAVVFFAAIAVPLVVLGFIGVYAAYRGFTGNAWRIPVFGRLADRVLAAPK